MGTFDFLKVKFRIYLFPSSLLALPQVYPRAGTPGGQLTQTIKIRNIWSKDSDTFQYITLCKKGKYICIYVIHVS